MFAEVDKFAFSHMALGYLMKGHVAADGIEGAAEPQRLLTLQCRLHANLWCLPQLLQISGGHISCANWPACAVGAVLGDSQENLYRSACWGFATVMESTHPKAGKKAILERMLARPTKASWASTCLGSSQIVFDLWHARHCLMQAPLACKGQKQVNRASLQSTRRTAPHCTALLQLPAKPPLRCC